MAEAAFNMTVAPVNNILDLRLRKKLVKCHVWGVGSYFVVNWTLRKV
jgi:hypothetical protein